MSFYFYYTIYIARNFQSPKFSLMEGQIILYNITLSLPMMTMCSNDTLVDTPFQLISGFFHVNQGVLCCEHAEQASSRGVLGGGGGGGGGGGNNRLAK